MRLIGLKDLGPEHSGEFGVARKPRGFQIPCDIAGDWARHVFVFDWRAGEPAIVEMVPNVGMRRRPLRELADNYAVGIALLDRTTAERDRTLGFLDELWVREPEYGKVDLYLNGFKALGDRFDRRGLPMAWWYHTVRAIAASRDRGVERLVCSSMVCLALAADQGKGEALVDRAALGCGTRLLISPTELWRNVTWGERAFLDDSRLEFLDPKMLEPLGEMALVR
ncbi:MAG: hypothetical protein GY946_29480 [bacterium]|nr:hypothetical protein [bacterium]